MKNIIFKHQKLNLFTLGLLVFSLAILSCEPSEDFPVAKAASVLTEGITSITGTSAISGGQIISDEGFQISTQGICWDTIQDPTLGKSFSLDTLGLNEFSNKLTGLKGGTTYFVRAFATNNGGISYGENETFITNVVPLITTNKVTEITGTSAKSGGNITETFGAQITDRGACWSTFINPSIEDEKVSLGAGPDSFETLITGLLPSVVYHVRSYAITSEGDVAYGEDILFETLTTDYDGNIYTYVQIGQQYWMVQNYICTSYSDGTTMEFDVDYTWHADDVNQEYGLNYKGATTFDPRFTPEGWHVPTKDEWLTLFDYVGWDGTKLKEEGTDHWTTDNGTNETGFTALGSSFIYGAPLQALTTWWSSTRETNGIPFRYYILDDGAIGGGPWNDDSFLFSVRLIRD